MEGFFLFTEKNFKNALEEMKFQKISDELYQKIFAENISMSVDFKNKSLVYPKNLKINRSLSKIRAFRHLRLQK